MVLPTDYTLHMVSFKRKDTSSCCNALMVGSTPRAADWQLELLEKYVQDQKLLRENDDLF